MSSWHPLPPQIFSFIQSTPGTVLLHSSRPGASRFSRLFTDPIRVIEVRDLHHLPSLFAAIEEAIHQGNFAAGYLTYECGEYFEPAAALPRGGDSDLLAWFAVYKKAHSFDHQIGTFDSDPLPTSRFDLHPEQASIPPSEIGYSLDEQHFAHCIDRIHDWIRSGDVYQLNFTFPVHLQTAESPAELYARLAAAQPVDYGAFLHTRPGHHVLSFSPELFFRIDRNRRITTQPMKGTAARGRTNSEDRAIAEALADDPKNRAENVMIVDLIRNDLGRICAFGSVHVDSLFEVARYPSLWQMTSSISGALRPDVSFEQIFRALFPCGSVTGAPKVHAMQLLAQIEQQPRGVYTGAIGCFSREESVFNVAIRTLELANGTAHGGIGSGIVIDSGPAAEYSECRLKAEFLTRSVEPFALIETMLWNGGFPFLDLHLDRIADSARYFDFVCDLDAIRTTLLIEASAFPGAQPRKVRLLLHANGEFNIENGVLPDVAANEAPPRICIAAHRTDPADHFLFHKTTRRDLYNRAHAAACSAGFADALFLNIREEITEGAVHNIVIEKAGRWYTPPLDCGVLPGVYRRHLLATRTSIEEKILTLDDVKAADSVYICNAVRGLRRVTIDWNAGLHLTN
ncbi:aminodeoxychorismate synthase component I [Occallatibacter savannae]|uniref:aminodeoxychorismate synthase component I n=1 Tax=Occallatibacter savannae TaxID=1002691 RepID=UPI000D698320|nr:aminodeoxychorismate synthase component I [Occallatibacter savannae]